MAPDVDCVVTHHLNPFGSGVARFNEILADGIGVDVVSVFDPRLVEFERPLLSFKPSEMSDPERAEVHRVLDREAFTPSVFLHEYVGLELEERLVRVAEFVFCGNHVVEKRLSGCANRLKTLWSPGLILDQRPLAPAEITVFSFGMAHKTRTDMFRRLRALLERSGRSYRLVVSAANHETASLHDADLIRDDLAAVFGDRLYFMGTLSDLAVYNWIRDSDLFAAFFVGGARANNSSIASAMEHGAAVLTNLDEHSPAEFVHMRNVIDINRADCLPSDPEVLERIGAAATRTAAERSWSVLLDHFRAPATTAVAMREPAERLST